MKKIFLLVLFLTSVIAIGQKLTVQNGAEVYDNNGKLFRYYGYGATLNLVKKYEDYAEVEIDGNIYKVQAKFYDYRAKKTITIGMDSLEVIAILGPPDHVSTFESEYSDSKLYVYGNTYYHFDYEKLTAINKY